MDDASKLGDVAPFFSLLFIHRTQKLTCNTQKTYRQHFCLTHKIFVQNNTKEIFEKGKTDKKGCKFCVCVLYM